MNIRTIAISALALLAGVSCSQRYEMNIPLSVSRDEIKLGSGEGKTYFMVYSTGTWTVSGESSWVSLSASSGKGQKQVDVVYSENTGLSRQSTFTVEGEGKTIEIRISQESGIKGDIAFGFAQQLLSLTNQAKRVSVRLDTDLPEEALAGMEFSVLYSDDDEEPWLGDFSFEDGSVSFDAEANSTGQKRFAYVNASLPVAYWDDSAPKTTLTVSQAAGNLSLGPLPAEIAADPDGSKPVTLTLNPPFSTDEFAYTIGYELESVAWLSGVSFEGNVFSAQPSVNYAEAREALLTFSLTYEGKEEDRATVRITQAHTTAGADTGTLPDETTKDDEQTF